MKFVLVCDEDSDIYALNEYMNKTRMLMVCCNE